MPDRLRTARPTASELRGKLLSSEPAGAFPLAKIFISYRHDDAPTAVAWITHTLSDHYGADNVFEYKDHAQPSKDFRRVIGSAIRKCDVMLAVVGKRWKLGRDDAALGIKGVDDWVRIEVETAIQLALPVVPVLVEGAGMPARGDVPESLSDFAFFTAVTVDTSNKNFHRDMQSLIAEINKLASEDQPAPPAAKLPPPPPLPPQPQPHPQPLPFSSTAYSGVTPGKSYQGMAIGSLVTAIVGVPLAFLMILGPIGIVLGGVARSKMNISGNRNGQGMALAGIIIGSIDILITFVWFLAMLNAK